MYIYIYTNIWYPPKTYIYIYTYIYIHTHIYICMFGNPANRGHVLGQLPPRIRGHLKTP